MDGATRGYLAVVAEVSPSKFQLHETTQPGENPSPDPGDSRPKALGALV
jgi:hypothetical protein